MRLVKPPAHPPLPRDEYTSIPQTIYLTYRAAHLVPEKVIERLKTLNPGFHVEVYGDIECLKYLQQYWSPDHVAFFKSIPHGPIRADFWRACIMYTHGGYYLDVDALPLVPFSRFVLPDIDVCTSGSFRTGEKSSSSTPVRQLNPMFIAARPRTRMMARAAGHMIVASRYGYSYWGTSLTFSLLRSIDDEMNMKIPSNTEGMYTSTEGEVLQLLTEHANTASETFEEHLDSLVTMWGDTVVIKNHDGDSYDSTQHRFWSKLHKKPDTLTMKGSSTQPSTTLAASSKSEAVIGAHHA